MAAEPWQKMFLEYFDDSLSFAGVARSRLAAVAFELASPLRGGEEGRALVRISECDHKLAEVSMLLGFAISALGTVNILALRCMRSDDAADVRDRAGARAARKLASDAYDSLSSCRGHLGAARRFVTATVIKYPYHAVDEERVAVLAAVEATAGTLLGMEAFRPIEDGVANVTLPRADSRPRSAAVVVAPTHIGAEGETITDAEWTVLGGSLPDALIRIALLGGVPEMAVAQAALRAAADAINKGSKLAAAHDDSAAAHWSVCYSASLRAFDAADAELSSLLALNSEVSIMFLRCTPHLGPDVVGNGWRSSDTMEASRADAERYGRAALDRVWTARARLDYCFLGVLVWGSTSSTWDEAREAMRVALIDAGKARNDGEQLRHAGSREFFHVACQVFKPAASSDAD